MIGGLQEEPPVKVKVRDGECFELSKLVVVVSVATISIGSKLATSNW